MTAFGGALNDPTKIVGSRIGAYVVDAILLAVLTIGVLWVFEVSNYPSRQFITSPMAARACDVSSFGRPGTSTGPPVSAINSDSSDRICFNVGRRAYVLFGSEARTARLHLTLYSVGLGLLYWAVVPAVLGFTPGKALFGLRVVTAKGEKAGIGRSLIRYVLLPIDSLCCGLVGFLLIRNSAGHRRLGDMAAGTYVVHRSAAGRLLNIPGHQVVRTHTEFGGWGPAPVKPELGLGEGGGIDAPAWDPARNTYVRYDQRSGVWFQWDDTAKAWIPAQT